MNASLSQMTPTETFVPKERPRADFGVKAGLVALRIYKLYLSALLGGTCRYQPTCSDYMYQAIERFGLARGIWLGTRRLVRCHPFARRFGYDPVPGACEFAEQKEDTHLKHSKAGGNVPNEARS
jgi:uncharacterized protein